MPFECPHCGAVEDVRLRLCCKEAYRDYMAERAEMLADLEDDWDQDLSSEDFAK